MNLANRRLSRRCFLQASATSVLELATLTPIIAAEKSKTNVNCIMIVMVGGPSQIDTFDPKPSAPVDVRGPFRPIATSVPGLRLSELLPRLAQHAGKFSLVRSLHHPEAVLHDAGHQLIQTGRAFTDGIEYPHIGSVVGYLGARPGHVVLPGPIGATGGDLRHGEGAGFLDRRWDPVYPTSWQTGQSRLGRSCLMARELIERGVRFVTINMYETVFGRPSWDMHGSAPFSDFQQLANEVAPDFDQAVGTLLQDLADRGLLQTTIVMAIGEFGRSPCINPHGGRDHHPHAFSMLIGGGPIHGGRIVGGTDEIGYQPSTRPIAMGDVMATLYQAMGIDFRQTLPGPHHKPIPLVEPGARPIVELLR